MELDKLTLEQIRECIPAATEEFTQLFDPEASVAAREITGGTGFNAVAAEIARWTEKLEKI